MSTQDSHSADVASASQRFASRPVRRTVLKSAGMSLALPMLESTTKLSEQVAATEVEAKVARAADNNAGDNNAGNNGAGEGTKTAGRAQRLICVGSNLGFYRPALYPKSTGRDYSATELLRPVDRHRDDFTVFSGFDHRSGNGHKAWDNYLCGEVIGRVSLDQIAAESIGQSNRFESLQLCAGDIPAQRMCYSRRGAPLPMSNRPSEVFRRVFARGVDRKRGEHLLRSGKSNLDVVRHDARRLGGRVSAGDRRKLEEYFTSLRELESAMGRQLRFLAEDAAVVDYELPPHDPVAPTMMLECEQIMFDLMALALQTDATRVATLFIAGLGQVFRFDGTTLRAGYHALSHHGNNPDLIRDLVRVEVEHFRCLQRFLDQLKRKTDADGRPLLDSTVVMMGTGMGDASRHSNRDLPILVAGGGFRHGAHRAAKNTEVLGNVFVSILRQLGVATDRFANARGGLDGWT